MGIAVNKESLKADQRKWLTIRDNCKDIECLKKVYVNRMSELVDASTTSGGISYRMVQVRRTGIRFPRLTHYRDKRIMQLVNRQIDELTKEFGCQDGGPSNSDSYEVQSRVEYAAKDIFSIYASGSWYCGGPYPTNDANMSVTFDLKTGTKVEFVNLFKNYEGDKDKILRTVFAKQVEQSERLIATGRPVENTCEGDPELFSMEHLMGSSYSYNFSQAGVVVQPDWPHVIEACAERVTVPYEKLREFAAPDGILARVIR